MISMLHLRHGNTAGRPRRTASRILKHATVLHGIICHNFQQQAKFTEATATLRPSTIFSTGEVTLRTSKLETPLSLCQTVAGVQRAMNFVCVR